MFICPTCKGRLSISVNVEDIPAEYSTNVLTNAITLVMCSLGNYGSINILGFKCLNCGNKFDYDKVLLKSQISNKIDVVSNFIIVSIKNKKGEIVNGKVTLVIPPKIIHKDELKEFKKFNPYEDDKYIVTNPISKINCISPK